MTTRADRIAGYVDVAASGAFSQAREALRTSLPVTDPQGILDLVETIAHAQRLVGERWASGELSVAQEHLVTQASTRIVQGAQPEIPLSKGIVIAAVAEGEWHSMPSDLLTTGLGSAGWEVVSTGPSMPAAHLASFVEQLGPRAVLLSCSLPANLPGAQRSISAVRESGVPVLVGGRGFGPDGRWAAAVGANQWAPTVSAAAASLDGLPDRVRAPEPKARSPHLAALIDSRAALIDKAAEAWSGGELSRREDLSLVVRSIHAALVVEDAAVFDHHVRWMAATPALGLGTEGTVSALLAIGDHLPESLDVVAGWIHDAVAGLVDGDPGQQSDLNSNGG